MTEQEMEQFGKRVAKEFAEAMKATGGTGNAKNAVQEERQRQKVLKELEKFQKSLKKTAGSTEEWEKNIDANIDTAEKLREQMEDLGMSTEDLDKGIEELDNQIVAMNKAKPWETAGRSVAAFSVGVISAGGALTKGLANALGNADSEFGSATSVMSAGAEAATLATSGTIKAFSVLGSMIPFVGDGLAKAGEYAEKAAQKLGHLAQSILPVMTAQMELNIQSFDTMTKSGAVFADGMTGMRRAVGEVEIPLATFSKGIAASAEQLSMTGLTAGQGAEQIGKAFASGDKMMKNKLRALGFSYDEQVSMAAQVAADYRAMGDVIINDPARLRAATENYAKNLVVLGALTGKDAKAKMEEARRVSSQFQFRNEAARLGLNLNNINTVLGELPADMQVGVQQMFGTGAISDPVTNQMMAMIPGYRESIMAMVAAMKNGSINTESGLKDIQIQMAKYKETMADASKSGATAAVGIASLHGAVPELAKAMQSMSDRILGPDAEATKKIIENAAKQKEANDALTKGITDASAASASMAKQMQDMVMETGALTMFAKTLQWSTDQTRKAISELAGLLPDDYGNSKTVDVIREWKNQTPDLSGAADDMNGTSLPSRKNGGLVDMPNTGGLAMLHGIEAVVPLPDGKSIPANINMPAEFMDALSALGKASNTSTAAAPAMNMQPLIDKLSEQNMILRAQLSLNQQVVEKITENTKVNKNILAYTR